MKVRISLLLGFAFLLSGTTFGAASWRLTSPALSDVRVTAIAVDPGTSNTMYVGGYTGSFLRRSLALYRSDDAGFTWRWIQNGLTGLSVVEILVNPATPNVAYVGVYGGGVFRSLDRGETWTNVNPSLVPWVNSLANDPRNPDTLYVALGGGGIYRTMDGGATWTLVSESLGVIGTVITSVRLDPVSSSVYAVGGETLYRSFDAGGTWQVVQQGIIALLWIDPTDPEILYAIGEGAVLLKSVDRGTTWTAIGAGLPTNAFLGPLRSDPTNPNVLYAGTGGAGVFRSADGGLTWTAFNDGIENRTVSALRVPPGSVPPLYAGTDAGLFDYRERADFQITLAAVASLHGVPPAFFHSDVWVFNGSTESEATVTATYRCLQGSPCSAVPQTFTIPPRQVKTFRDVAVSLFHSPESAGAVELESDRLIVVTSRLYTPDVSQPTTGMFVRGSPPEEAHVKQVLLSLSHSADLGRGFRTNVGFFNPTDTGTFVQLDFFDQTGASLGQILSFARPRQAIQLNDDEIFARLGIDHEVSNFSCTVLAYPYEGVRLFAYAAVIDNRSGDPFFVPGENAAASPESKITLPAVASLHGAAGTFFHSDVRIWNAAGTEATVTARFACFEGGCGERVFTVAPRRMAVWDDVVTSLFHSASTGGAMEFVSAEPLVVTSRLYTPSAAEPTFGMFVPGLPPERSSPAVVLNGLSHPADRSTGSRVNVGVFNPADVAQVVTYRLFDGGGNQIGQRARFFGPREFFQANDVFAFLSVSGAVEPAYCLVEGSEQLPLFAYAAVIDNRSQDPILIPGEDDPEHSPITPLAPQ